MNRKPIASLSLDLDNKWSYMKTHGDAGWEAFPSYLDVLVPRVLAMLDELKLKITFFVVGQDAALERNAAVLRSIADAGHEIGNHSFKHEPWLHLYSDAEIADEIRAGEEAIRAATGYRTVGFRGPGFSCSKSTLTVLADRGYAYDASTFPTFLGPLARVYYFMRSNLSRQELDRRKALFGTWSEGLRPLKPYRWDLGGRGLVEIPVTTMPGFRVPIHASYVLYLSCFSTLAARAYFRSAMTMCRATGTPPSILLHPLDFLGAEDEKDLSFFPAMNLPREKKLGVMRDVLQSLAKHYEVVPMAAHAEQVRAAAKVKTRVPRFATAAAAGETPLVPSP